jgi:hypothetical protein
MPYRPKAIAVNIRSPWQEAKSCCASDNELLRMFLYGKCYRPVASMLGSNCPQELVVMKLVDMPPL